MEPTVKSPLLSKTLWLNLIGAVSALFVPGVSEWMAAHPELVAMLFAGMNMVLRLISKDKIGIE